VQVTEHSVVHSHHRACQHTAWRSFQMPRSMAQNLPEGPS
jgi:hypothetical protein